jgi:hypothetical protein
VNNERRKRRLWPWLVVLGLLAALLAYMYWPTGPVKIIISRQTTYIDGPLNADGTVNYVAYLDANYAKGVTPENNAAPLLLRVCGPDMLPEPIRGQTLARLNLPADFFDDRDKQFILWKDRARPGKAGATMPSRGDDKTDANDEDEQDRGPSLDEVYDMALAGQIHPDLEAWLAENAGPLELVRQAAAKERYYIPLVSGSNPPFMVEVLIPDMRWCRQAAEALTVQAVLKMTRNDPRGAWDDVLSAHRLARLLDQAPTVIEQLVAVGIEGTAAMAGIALATRGHMPPSESRELLSKLAALRPVGHMVDTIDKEERFCGLDAVMMLSRPGGLRASGLSGTTAPPLSDSADLDWDQMLGDMNAQYDWIVKPMRLPRFHGREEAQKASDEEFKKFETGLKGGPMAGLRLFLLKAAGRPFRKALTTAYTNILIAIMIPALGQACNLEDQAKMTQEIETLAAALTCYHAENGRWPAELKELCPSLLKTIPTDRFSVKPLVYRPSKDGYLLYSVGKNLRDDGGQREPRSDKISSAARKDDIAAEVKPAEATSKPVDTKPAEAASKPAQTKPTDAKPAKTSSRFATSQP